MVGEGWKFGGLEGWKFGSLEVWRLGGATEVEARAAALGGDETVRGADAPTAWGRRFRSAADAATALQEMQEIQEMQERPCGATDELLCKAASAAVLQLCG